MKTRRLRRNIPRIHRIYTYFRSSEESLFEFWLWFFKLFVLGLFLFEEATESVYGVDGILPLRFGGDRKSTRLNSSHDQISYAVFCLKKKKKRIYYVYSCT